MTATILSPTDLAAEFDTTPREVRKFLRSITPAEDRPGKGARWEIKKGQVRSLRPKYNAWVEAKTPEVKDEAPAQTPSQEPTKGSQEEDLEPTAEELEAIAAEG